MAVLSGTVVAVQSRVNGRLAEAIGHFSAAGVSFFTGLALLSLLLLSVRFRAHVARVPAAIGSRRLPWWHVLGGVGGGLLVSTQTYAVPLVGVAAFLVAVIAGQGISALVVDRQGWGPAPATALSWPRLVAAALTVAGVAIATAASGSTPGGPAGMGDLLPVGIAFLVGLLGSVQYALNGRVTTVSADPFATALINFAVGTCTVVAVGGMAMLTGLASLPRDWDAPWWAWLGGACGVVFIAGAAWAVQHTGVLVFGLVAVSSQLGGGLALDLFNPAMSERIGAQFVLGLSVAVVGAVGAGLSARSQRAVQFGPARDG